MKVTLIGFMGAGKSTVAEYVADKLGIELIEIDKKILTATGFRTVNQIFAEKGEAYYREQESKAIAEIANLKEGVIDAGGGAVIRSENIDAFKANRGRIVYLYATWPSIMERLKGDQTRPLFKDPLKAKGLYKERLPLYEAVADVVVPTDKKSAKEVAEQVVSSLSEMFFRSL